MKTTQNKYRTVRLDVIGGKSKVVATYPYSRPEYKSNYDKATQQELLAYYMLVHLDCKS